MRFRYGLKEKCSKKAILQETIKFTSDTYLFHPSSGATEKKADAAHTQVTHRVTWT